MATKVNPHYLRPNLTAAKTLLSQLAQLLQRSIQHPCNMPCLGRAVLRLLQCVFPDDLNHELTSLQSLDALTHTLMPMTKAATLLSGLVRQG